MAAPRHDGLPRAGRGRWRWRWRLAAVGAGVLVFLAALAALQRRVPPRAPSGPTPPAADPSEDAGVAAEALTPEEVAHRVGQSTALASCEGQSGRVFFLEPERAVGRVDCADLAALSLPDARELLGQLVGRDARLGVAVLEVLGAAAPPLPLGDSTALASGESLYQVVEAGTEVAIRERTLARTGRAVAGFWLAEMEPVPGGEAPGPVLDRGGRLVGLAARPGAPEERDLFLPVEYLRPLFPGVAPPTPESVERWRRALRRAEEEDRSQAESFSRGFSDAVLVQATVAVPGLLDAVVARRWTRPPAQETLAVVVLDEGRVLCTGSAEAREWLPAGEAERRLGLEGPLARRLRWAMDRGAATGLLLSRARVDLGGCPVERASPGAVLAVEGAGRKEASVRFPRAALLDAAAQAGAEAEGRRREAAEARRQLEQGERDRAESEAAWRQAFRDAHGRIARLEALHATLRAEEALASSHQAWVDLDRVRREAAEVEGSLAGAREDLAELERQASFQAVPREWRR